MGPLPPLGIPDTQEADALRARLRRLEEENARLLERERTRLEETRALAGIGRLLSERLEPDVVGLRIAESLRSLLAAGSAVVYRLDVASQSLMALAVSRTSDPSVGWRATREPGSGAVGLAIRERRTITTPDVLADPRIETSAGLRQHLEQAPDRAILAVPLLTQDRLIGVLAVRNATGSVFDARAVQMAEALADQAALTLEHARLFADEEHRRREAEILADLARTIGGTLDLPTVLRRVTEAAQELCRSDGAVIGLRVPGSDTVRLRYWTAPWYDTLADASVEPGQGLGGLVLAERRPLRTSDYLRDPRITDRYQERIRRFGVHAQMAVPVLIDDRVEGLLYVDNRTPARLHRPGGDHPRAAGRPGRAGHPQRPALRGRAARARHRGAAGARPPREPGALPVRVARHQRRGLGLGPGERRPVVERGHPDPLRLQGGGRSARTSPGGTS